jgi:hypothetical protein
MKLKITMYPVHHNHKKLLAGHIGTKKEVMALIQRLVEAEKNLQHYWDQIKHV